MGKKYLVVGLGATGMSCIRYLVSMNQSVIAVDSRHNPPNVSVLKEAFPEVEVYCGPFSLAVFGKATVLVVSPGVSLNEPCIQAAIKKQVPVIGDVEIFAKVAKAPIIAITGSNGKSTLTTLVGQMITAAGLKAVVCGNIGLPVLDAIAQPVPDYYVVELSSFQLDTTHSLKSKVAVVINVSADHMDRYAALADYMASKQRVYNQCEYALVNADEPEIWQSLSFQNPPIAFTLKNPNENQWGVCDGYLACGEENLIPISDLLLRQRHNHQNFLAALAIGTCLGLSRESMFATLRQFAGLPHRCQLISQAGQVYWYNDSKATNVGAAIAAIESTGESFDGELILLAGGDSKGVSLFPLQSPVKKHVSHAILFGRDAVLLEGALIHCAQISRVNTLREGVQLAKAIAKPGDVVLLAPACASLDQYENYIARGDDFSACVAED